MNGFDNFKLEINEEIFTLFQKPNPWFNMQLVFNNIEPLKYDDIKDIKTLEDANEKELEFLTTKRIIFAKIFGSFGLEVNLDEAESLAKECLIFIDKYCKYNNVDLNNINKDSQLDIGCLFDYATVHIILGTVYAYKKEYIKASYHFLLGLRANIVDLNYLYSDFINYIFQKLKDLPKKKATYTGPGFSEEEYMGYKTNKEDNKILIPSSAEKYIPLLKSKKGELVVAKQTIKRVLGVFNRTGSIYNDKINCNIDIYKTLLVDKDYNLKEITFYFNNYRPRSVNTDSSFIIPDDFDLEI